MGRCYKAVVFSLIFSFLMVEDVFAYQIYDFNLQQYREMLNKSQINNNIDTQEVIDVQVVSSQRELNAEIQSINYKIIQKDNLSNFMPKASVVEKDEVSLEEDKKEVINLNDEQLYLLSKLVAAEARGETYKGQVAVAAVVLNRVKDSRFPDSIEGVIYQKNAFSVVRNGQIDINPTEESYNAAKEALYGNDPTNRAIYFWNPDISTCKWIKTLNPHLRIGNHVFAR